MERHDVACLRRAVVGCKATRQARSDRPTARLSYYTTYTSRSRPHIRLRYSAEIRTVQSRQGNLECREVDLPTRAVRWIHNVNLVGFLS